MQKPIIKMLGHCQSASQFRTCAPIEALWCLTNRASKYPSPSPVLNNFIGAEKSGAEFNNSQNKNSNKECQILLLKCTKFRIVFLYRSSTRTMWNCILNFKRYFNKNFLKVLNCSNSIFTLGIHYTVNLANAHRFFIPEVFSELSLPLSPPFNSIQ